MKRKVKEELDMKIARKTPVDDSISGLSENEMNPKIPFYKNPYFIGIGSGALVGAAVLGIVIATCFPPSPSIPEDKVMTTPVLRERNTEISARSSEIYMAFVENFVIPVLDVFDGEESYSFSIPDFFMTSCLTAYLSDDVIGDEFLKKVGASSMDELCDAAYDIGSALCSLEKDSEGRMVGGFVACLVFLDEIYTLKAKEEAPEIYSTVEEKFFGSIFNTMPSDEELHGYLEELSPDGMPPVPEINIPEDADCMSSSLFQAVYRFSEESVYYLRESYMARRNLLDYTLPDGTVKQVPAFFSSSYNSAYIAESQEASTEFEGCGYSAGAGAYMNCFMPAEGYTPGEVLVDALLGHYESRLSGQFFDPEDETSEYYGILTEPFEWGYRLRTANPYFRTKQETEFGTVLAKEWPSIETRNAFLGKIISDESAFRADFLGAKQFSEVTYDYNGLAVSSYTVEYGDTESAMPIISPYEKIIYMDEPHAYYASAYVRMDGKTESLPIICGVIVDPAYE